MIMRRAGLKVLLFAILQSAVTHCALPAVECAAGQSQANRQPNVVIILVDDMGYGDPACFNSQSKIATPNIDRLAREGMKFTDAHAAGSLCHLSRYGLLTGAYPFRTNVAAWPKQPVIKAGQMTIASLLRSQGYRTAMVGKWHLGFAENGYDKKLPGGPVDCGFDSFFGFRASTDIPPYFYIKDDRALMPPTSHIAASASEGWSPIQGAFWREGDIAPDLQLKDVLPRLTEEAVGVIRNHAQAGEPGKPLMLYFATTAPHTPWLPAEEFRGRSQAELYGDFSMMVDAMIGRILAALDEAKMADNTLVIFSSDNGPTWYPADVKRTGHDSAGGLRGMKGLSWEAGHRVPFVVRWPGRTKPGSASQQMICFTDVLATLAELTGASLPDDAGPDSLSFLPVLLGTQPENRPVRESLAVNNSYRSGAWKWIAGHEPASFGPPNLGFVPPKTSKPGQLYNLTDDLAETKNLIDEQPEIVARLQRELEQLKTSPRSRPEK